MSTISAIPATDIDGIPEPLRSYIRDDSLSPVIRDSIMRATSAGDVESLKKIWSKLVNEYKEVVEKFKPVYIPPRQMQGIGAHAYYVDEPLIAEEVGCWIDRDEEYMYLTYWYKFPYDLWPGDGEEYEPWTIVLRDPREGAIEYQARTHWRIVHIDPRIVIHIDRRPLITFADHAHTPVPILDLVELSRILNADLNELIDKVEAFIDDIVGFVGEEKLIQIEKLSALKSEKYNELEDYVSMKRYARCLLEGVRKFYGEDPEIVELEYTVLVHVGPSRRNPPPHNPLKERWTSKPVFY